MAQSQSANQEQTEKESYRTEEDHPGNLAGGEAQRRVEAVTHRGAGEQSKTQGIGEGISHVGGERYLGIGDLASDLPHGQGVIERQQQITQYRSP